MAADRPVDTRVRVGSIELPHAVMTAAGTSGHGAELARYCDLSRLGAVVVKSLSVMPWPGNPAPRLHPLPDGMINSVGLQGPGVAGWFDEFFPELVTSRSRVVISVWGRSLEEYRQAALAVADGIRRVGRSSPGASSGSRARGWRGSRSSAPRGRAWRGRRRGCR